MNAATGLINKELPANRLHRKWAASKGPISVWRKSSHFDVRFVNHTKKLSPSFDGQL